MIKHIETLTAAEQSEICSFCLTSCIGLKAVAPLISYGTQYDFAKVWVQRGCDDADAGDSADAPITAFISKFYGDAVLFAAPTADTEELQMFMRAIGYADLVSSVPLYGAQCSGYIMRLDADKPCIAKVTEDITTIIENDNLKGFYELLCKNYPDNVFSRYDEWLVDLSHRVRHGTTQTAILECGGIPVATAAALVITDEAVLLGAISVNGDCRGKHYAHTLVRHYADRFEDRTVYIMCKPDKVGLYEKAGFENVDKFYRI